MKILVLVKEVPDMEKVKFDSERGVVDRSSAEAEINPFDENALQAAVNLKNSVGAEVTVLTMGPPRAEKSLRDAYARGADRLVLLTDRKFGGSDTCATARTLAAAVEKLGGFDLILCGEKSVDGDTAQVGAETAEFLGLPHVYYAEEIQCAAEEIRCGAEGTVTEIRAVIENLGGETQTRRLRLPAVVGVTKNICTPKLPTVKRKLASLEAQVEVLTMDELASHMKEEETGFKGSPTKVAKIRVPKENVKENVLMREDITGFIRTVGAALADKGLIANPAANAAKGR